MLANIVGDFAGMPEVMKRLALAQFFSWSALFIMWINTTPVVAQNFYGAADPASAGEPHITERSVSMTRPWPRISAIAS